MWSGLLLGKYRGMIEFHEGDMKNGMDAIVGRKAESIGHGVNALGDLGRTQFCVIQL